MCHRRFIWLQDKINHRIITKTRTVIPVLFLKCKMYCSWEKFFDNCLKHFFFYQGLFDHGQKEDVVLFSRIWDQSWVEKRCPSSTIVSQLVSPKNSKERASLFCIATEWNPVKGHVSTRSFLSLFLYLLLPASCRTHDDCCMWKSSIFKDDVRAVELLSICGLPFSQTCFLSPSDFLLLLQFFEAHRLREILRC